jgi:hypothetical protein
MLPDILSDFSFLRLLLCMSLCVFFLFFSVCPFLHPPSSVPKCFLYPLLSIV